MSDQQNQGYGLMSSAQPSPPQRSVQHDGMAVASLVLSLVGLWGVGSILGIIFGYVSRRKARDEGREQSGMALAGIVLGYIGLVLTVIITIVIIAVAVHDSNVNAQNACNNQGGLYVNGQCI